MGATCHMLQMWYFVKELGLPFTIICNDASAEFVCIGWGLVFIDEKEQEKHKIEQRDANHHLQDDEQAVASGGSPVALANHFVQRGGNNFADRQSGNAGCQQKDCQTYP